MSGFSQKKEPRGSRILQRVVEVHKLCSMLLTTSKGPEVVSSTHLSRTSDCLVSFTQFVCSSRTSASAVFPGDITIQEQFPWSYCIVACIALQYLQNEHVPNEYTVRAVKTFLSSRLLMNSRRV